MGAANTTDLDAEALILHVLLGETTGLLGESSGEHEVGVVGVIVLVWKSLSALPVVDDRVRHTGALEQLLHGLLPAGGEELVSLIDDGEPSIVSQATMPHKRTDLT